MTQQYRITLPPFKRGMHLITHFIEKELKNLPACGLVNIFLCHTSAGLMLNENADPSVMKDMHRIFDEMVPENQSWYTHRSEGSDDMPAHAKSALCGHSLSIPIVNGHLGLGIWQGICLCEFRNHASGRTIVLTVIS